jgi:hypothetical protein
MLSLQLLAEPGEKLWIMLSEVYIPTYNYDRCLTAMLPESQTRQAFLTSLNVDVITPLTGFKVWLLYYYSSPQIWV